MIIYLVIGIITNRMALQLNQRIDQQWPLIIENDSMVLIIVARYKMQREQQDCLQQLK